ncbi:MAG: SurA N-terminal domain-containing protein [Bacteroidales bacterium]|nr:SurA N-terminal domain-containing protein [Bacteroidales bacterium]MEE3406352.1 SurA N-terminal domain-containing protein [Candidatus Cryptobacteroides sp.]MBP5740848.1 SurA N-terminal domain-containing protein [Bacteroidales bacterium]MBQ2108389.1 SurA N-terminal domain-containing protein [Bacteroidales bacterium]MBQ3996795.1 SurA N-terminal domain-containing protein [Bacteroidales bacterium]
MAVLKTLRSGKLGAVATILVALGLLSFIIDPNEVISAFNNMSSKYDVGEINGKAISYTDFQDDIQRFSTINEMLTGNQGAAQQDQIRDAAWQDLVYRHLFIRNAKDAGINVGDAEMIDLTSGDRLSPLVANNNAFLDENGNFSREAVASIAQASKTDENVKLYWNYLQNSIYTQQYIGKYSSLFVNSAVVNPLMLRKEIEENNNTADVEFVMLPVGFAPDSTVSVSDKEVKAYYDVHKKLFKQQASRDIEYVVFEVVPSADDIANTRNSVAELQGEFAEAANVKSFLLKNGSERAYSEYWYKAGELNTVSSAVEDFVWNGKTATSDIIANGNTFYLARVVDSKMVPDSAYVKHILLQGTGAKVEADSLLGVLKAGKETFANLAALYSADKGSAADGEMGNIGWMTQNYMIPGFESVLNAETGKPFILDTQYGTHIVVVSKKTAPVAKKQVAIFEKTALASKETFNSYYSKANNFQIAAAGSYENYRKAVDTLGVYSHPVSKMLESSNRLGSIENTREVTRWAFENKAGKVSNIITVDNNYFFIATVKGIHKEGFAPVADVAPSIRQELLMEKTIAKKAEDVAAQIAGMDDLAAIAEKLGTTVSTSNDVAFSSVSGTGLDPKFIGAVAAAPEGKICGPVAGSVGVFVFKVTGRETGAFYTEDDAKTRDAQLAQYMTQMILPVMMDDAEVKDNRARFY